MLNLISACGQVAAHVIYREQGVAGTLHDRRQAKPPHEKRSGLKLSRNEAHTLCVARIKVEPRLFNRPYL